MKKKNFMMLLVEHGEGHAVEISGLKAQVAQLVHENTLLTISAEGAKESAADHERRAADTGRELATMTLERDTERRQRHRAEKDLADTNRTAVHFPYLMDKLLFVYIAFGDTVAQVAGAADDAGDYTDAGNFADYAALIAAPLNPRCYVTCHALKLIRLPASPVGKLRLADDIPF